ncbi:hypothetical protein HUG10_19555 (plasmid) [Halorarum halophilum]|uniref:Uncharacterized protein n=1 Tax=Halorarum halophilum TaxID=2743090 RepID=A0A7D5GKI1_9EURY|nr:hypothetical protein [Halobaculum halophilum]QLG29811.1 hypothetical protein HUG10_19555 [Halobaculum halophilum]
MVSEQTWIDAGRSLAFLLLYGLTSAALTTTALSADLHPYLRVAVALTLSLGVVAVVDAVPRLIRGDEPLLGVESRLYSVRGVVLIILVILVTAVTADLLRATTTFPETVLILTAVVVGAVVVLGPVIGYYWRQSVAQSR